MSSTFSSQMSREDQVNLNSYANTFISSNFFFSRFKYLWNPMANPSQKPQMASTLSWCSGAHHSRYGGTVTTMKNDPPPLVLRQFQPATKLGPIGHTIYSRPIWPLLVLYGIFGHITIPWPFLGSSHILQSLASLANSLTLNPQACIFVLVLGVSLYLLGGSGSPSHHQWVWTNPFH
ncbi:hypothetical protein O181_104978 [Austropuccinia psidii MF-1]|uniref:Uncharacterized protein n=1 Tax=Austropuccinia psidii MF-1 TaxID=1389203 RepID=A0A9Q3PKJ2_9BASI|nr:hypothetical protein [Austropuccinia psidii MF-1]